MTRPPLHIMILTGEPSGDFHAAPLIRALRSLVPGVRISGIGGPAMTEAGADIFYPIDRLSAMGLVQVIRQFSSIRRAYDLVRHRLKNDRPDAVVLIDYPGFNLRVAEQINRSIPVCYYIAPKVWAWNASRLSKIKAYVDHVALILPFELPIYKKKQIPASYVGNPLMDEYPVTFPAPGKKESRSAPVIGLLPGSRASEVGKLLPVMLDAAAAIGELLPRARFLVSSGTAAHAEKIRQMVDGHPCRNRVTVVRGRPGTIFQKADMAVAASGTVTLEAALCGLPTIIVYKVSPLTYRLGKRLVKVKYVGLANLIVGREVMPELLQSEASPGQISRTAMAMVHSLDRHRRNLLEVRRRLGTPGAPARTAKIVYSLIRSRADQ